MHLLTVEKDQEVLESLTRQIADLGIRNAAIVSLIGAVDACAISNMPAEDAKKDIVTEYRQPMELTGSGDIAEGQLHIHVTLSREGDECVGGHLHWAQVRTFFVKAYVEPMS